MARRSPQSRSLRRAVGTKRPRRTYRIFCEGTRTEPEYLSALRRHPAVRQLAAVELVVAKAGGKPRTLVTAATAAKDKAREQQDEVDEFWCVFDVEQPGQHPGLAEAIRDARRHRIRVAVSNPCFELWLILHFQDQTGWLDTAGACELRRRLDGARDKGVGPDMYMPRVLIAAARARELDERHQRDDLRFPHDNPSSGMHRLISAIGPPGWREAGG